MDLGALLSEMGVRAVDAAVAEEDEARRRRVERATGVRTRASEADVLEALGRAKHEVAEAKALGEGGQAAYDRARMRRQVLRAVLQAMRERERDGLLDMVDSVRLGEQTPFEASRKRARRADARAPSPAPPAHDEAQEEGPDKQAHAVKGDEDDDDAQTIVREDKSDDDDEYDDEAAGWEEERRSEEGDKEEEEEEGAGGKRRRREEVEEVERSEVMDDSDTGRVERRLEQWHAEADAWMKGLPAQERGGPQEVLVEGGRGGLDVEDEDWATVAREERTLRVHRWVWDRLLKFQRTGLRWLWELHCARVGGIVGDEMGLGKTVQLAAFLHGLDLSGALGGPVLIVCPATLMSNWMRELNTWAPALRVYVLHSSGHGMQALGWSKERILALARPAARGAAAAAARAAGTVVVITTYAAVRQWADEVVGVAWDYVILDEGHTIRNPHAAVSKAVRRVTTPHRIVLSGSPVQNSLRELWALVDFCFPGRLGDLPTFETQFVRPIVAGGWANASPAAAAVAFERASALKTLVSSFLLRRRKRDVAAQLPPKEDKVLPCRLTPVQRRLYRALLDSDLVRSAIEQRGTAFKAIAALRAACNHPWLLAHSDEPGEHRLGRAIPAAVAAERSLHGAQPAWEDSGKMRVLAAALAVWKQQGRRVLLFSQGRQMLDLLERFALARGYSYLRMDGTTPVRQRGRLVDRFNRDPDVFLFLLTTRVGGVGLNLVGADTVLIFDPDWNPATDAQAKERSWRIGQTRRVVIFRLVTAGTIEEKIWQRQMWKDALQKQVLTKPSAVPRRSLAPDSLLRESLSSRDLRDLFTLDEPAHDDDDARALSDAADAGAHAAATAADAAQGPAAAAAAAAAAGDNDDDDELMGSFLRNGNEESVAARRVVETASNMAPSTLARARRAAADAALLLRNSGRSRRLPPRPASTPASTPASNNPTNRGSRQPPPSPRSPAAALPPASASASAASPARWEVEPVWRVGGERARLRFGRVPARSARDEQVRRDRIVARIGPREHDARSEGDFGATSTLRGVELGNLSSQSVLDALRALRGYRPPM